MFKFEEITNVADNKVVLNGHEFMVTDDIAKSIYELIKGVKPSNTTTTTQNTTKIHPVKSKSYTFKDKDVKWCKPVKVDGGYAYGLDGYVNTLTFRYVAECLKDSSRYVKGIGFIFTKKSEGDKLTKAITKVTAEQQKSMMK